MKKMFLLAALCCTISAFAETSFVYNADSHELEQTKDGIKVTIAKGSGSVEPLWKASWNEEYNPSDMRLYLGNTITVTSDAAMTSIKMVFAKSAASSSDYAGLSASVGDLVSGGTATSNSDWKVDTWTGSAKSVTFTLTGKGQRRIYSLVVNGEALMPEVPEEKPLPTAADLVSGYDYHEPTIVGSPDTTILKKEYAFITNNILVHCDMGSIEKEYIDPNADEENDDSHPAYFNCNANYTITFTAAQNIKGIAISGFVRKAFNASCDHGSITYLTNPDQDMEGWPALVVTDINDKTVTLLCPKQLRCYEVKVYFQNNPDPIPMNSTDIHMVNSKCPNGKYIYNGILYLQRGDELFNAQGARVR